MNLILSLFFCILLAGPSLSQVSLRPSIIPFPLTRCCSPARIRCPRGQHCEERSVVCVRAPCLPIQSCVPNCPSGQNWQDCPTCQKDNFCPFNCNPPGYCTCPNGMYRTGTTCSRFCPLVAAADADQK